MASHSLRPGSGADVPQPPCYAKDDKEKKTDHYAMMPAVHNTQASLAHKSTNSSSSSIFASFVVLASVLFLCTVLSLSFAKTTALISIHLSELPSVSFLDVQTAFPDSSPDLPDKFAENSTVLPADLSAFLGNLPVSVNSTGFLASLPSQTFLAAKPSSILTLGVLELAALSAPTPGTVGIHNSSSAPILAASAPTPATTDIHVFPPLVPQLAADNAPEVALSGYNASSAPMLAAFAPTPVATDIHIFAPLVPQLAADAAPEVALSGYNATSAPMLAASAPTPVAMDIHIFPPLVPQLAADTAPEVVLSGHNVTTRLLRSVQPASTIPMAKLSRNTCKLIWLLPAVPIVLLVGHMMPQRQNSSIEVGNLRVPPPWGPHMSTPTFRDWAWTVMVWSIYSDLDPARKAAALTLQLRGGALMLIRALPPQTLLQGGLVNGVQVDAMTYIMHALAERYGQLGEEVRLSAISELFTFSAQRNERIDDLLTRFDVLHERAQAEGQMHMSVQALVWLLLKACNVTDSQLQQLLAPTQGLFPANADQFAALQVQMRRMGHIVENSPGNIASILRRSPHSADHTLFTERDATAPQQPALQTASAFPMQGAEASSSSTPWHQSAPWTSSQPGYGPGMDWQPPAWSAGHAYPAHAYAANTDNEWSDNGTDTDTESDLEDGELEVPLPPTASTTEVAHHLWWAYSTAKSNWRRFMGKPVRAVRRFLRRKGHTKGGTKGKGYGKPSAQAFLADLPDESSAGPSATVLFKGLRKGKGGKGYRSSGKGKGRISNPLGPDGNPMVCRVPGCGSTTHFERDHPGGKGADKGKGKVRFTGLAISDALGPFGDLIESPAPQPASNHLVLMVNSSDSDMSPAGLNISPPVDQAAAAAMAAPVEQTSATATAAPQELPLVHIPVATDPMFADDPWLAALRNMVANPGQPAGLPVAPPVAPPLPTPPYHQSPPWTTSSGIIAAAAAAAARPVLPQHPPPPYTPAIATPIGTTAPPLAAPRAPSVAASDRTVPVGTTSARQPATAPPTAPAPQAPPGLQQMQIVPPPAELPTWVAAVPQLHLDRPMPILGNPMAPAPPLFPGARTEALPLPSRATLLDQPLRGPIDDIFRITHAMHEWQASGATRPEPAVETISRLEPAHHNYIDQLHLISRQQASARAAANAKGKGKGKPRPAYADEIATAVSSADVEVEFDGDDRICSICLCEFEAGDAVCRLVCRHLFHVECWHNLLVTNPEDRIFCPNCRGPGRTIARFRYVASPVHVYREPLASEPPRVHLLPSASSREPSIGSHASYQSTESQSAFPCWASDAAQVPLDVYHATTSLPNGRLGVIVDVGSWWNLLGHKLARQAAERAISHGFPPKQQKLEQPLQIQGVGDGTQLCEWQASITIASPDETGAASLHTFEAPVVGGTGAGLPGLLGHKTIRDKEGVLQTAPGKEMLSFPGPGGYKIEWSPGTKHFPLTVAPSGHLIIPIDEYDKVPPAGGLAQRQMAFHTDQRPGSTSSSSRDGMQPSMAQSSHTPVTSSLPVPALSPPSSTPKDHVPMVEKPVYQ